jgi:hypothetical protein
MRLIDADELCNELSTVCDDRYDRTVEWCIGILRQAPTIDAVEVVRCENCKYFVTNYAVPHCGRTLIGMKKSNYCSYGERKTDEIQTH